MKQQRATGSGAARRATREDGIYKNACRMCHGGCGVLLHLEDGRLVQVSGDPDSPLNRGRLCPKGAASLEQVYHPDRLAFPLRRAGERGGGDWVWTRTRRSAIRQRARLSDGIDPRVVHVEHSWWFPEEPGPEHGVFRSNANILTDDDPPYDPAMGTYQLPALLCLIEKAEAPEA